jgi:hypothetical protein
MRAAARTCEIGDPKVFSGLPNSLRVGAPRAPPTEEGAPARRPSLAGYSGVGIAYSEDREERRHLHLEETVGALTTSHLFRCPARVRCLSLASPL